MKQIHCKLKCRVNVPVGGTYLPRGLKWLVHTNSRDCTEKWHSSLIRKNKIQKVSLNITEGHDNFSTTNGLFCGWFLPPFWIVICLPVFLSPIPSTYFPHLFEGFSHSVFCNPQFIHHGQSWSPFKHIFASSCLSSPQYLCVSRPLVTSWISFSL
jgi:hypothetical protein